MRHYKCNSHILKQPIPKRNKQNKHPLHLTHQDTLTQEKIKLSFVREASPIRRPHPPMQPKLYAEIDLQVIVVEIGLYFFLY